MNLGHRIKRELLIHADRVMTIDLPSCCNKQNIATDAAA